MTEQPGGEWILLNFGAALEDWVRREKPSGDLSELVARWIDQRLRFDYPYNIAQQERPMDNLFGAAVPGTDTADGDVVMCWFTPSPTDGTISAYNILTMPRRPDVMRGVVPLTDPEMDDPPEASWTRPDRVADH